MFNLETRLLLALGHTIRKIDGTGTFRFDLPDFTPDSILYIEDLLSQIADVDALYSSALEDSMAEQVDTLKVNYGAHLALIGQRGTVLLKRLAAFSNVPLVFNQFSGTDLSPSSPKGNPPLAVRSYY